MSYLRTGELQASLGGGFLKKVYSMLAPAQHTNTAEFRSHGVGYSISENASDTTPRIFPYPQHWAWRLVWASLALGFLVGGFFLYQQPGLAWQWALGFCG